ncbi:MAG TPA: PspC domain-containing protein [Pseudonocardiaceae bacterium]
MTENSSAAPAATPQDTPPYEPAGAQFPGAQFTGTQFTGAPHAGTQYPGVGGTPDGGPYTPHDQARASSGWQGQLADLRSSPAWQQTQATAGKVFRRSRTDKMISGVCGGLARSLKVDPSWLRLGLIAATVLGFGAGVVIYAVCWVVVPMEDDASIAVSQ